MLKKPQYLFTLLTVLVVGAAFWLSSLETSNEPPAIIPRELLFGHPEKARPSLSPDGTQIAFLAPDAKHVLNVWVGPVDDLSQATPVTTDKHRGVRQYFWQADGNAILHLRDGDGDEDWHLLQTNVTTRVTRDLTPFSGIHTEVVAYEYDYPNEILVAMNIDDSKLFDIYRIFLDSGAVKLDTRNPGDVHDWVADNNLQVRVAHAYLPDGGTVTRIRDDNKSEWRTLLTCKPEDAISSGTVVAFSPDNQSAYALTAIDHNTAELIAIDTTTGVRSSIAKDARYDVNGILADPNTHKLQAATVQRERLHWIPLDDSIRPDFKQIEKAVGPTFQIASRTRNDRQWILASHRDTRPTEYHLYDRDTKKTRFLFTTLPRLKNYALVPMKPIQFQARDGLLLEGYLTLPGGRPAKNLPTVIYVHGGPWTRDTWEFNPAVQWMANRGYAVLQVNYRGSTGYGKAHLAAGDKEWGGKMQEDLIDAKRWLVGQGIANPDKVALYGGSYGGYATLAGLAFTPEEFCCGIDVVGPSNLVTLLSSFPPYWSPAQALFNSRIGNIETEQELLRERSPLFKADQINKPLLIAHGANDPRVKQQEADQIVSVMRQNKQSVQYLLFPDEGHGFARPDNRRRFIAAAELFLATNLGGAVEPHAPSEEWSSIER